MWSRGGGGLNLWIDLKFNRSVRHKKFYLHCPAFMLIRIILLFNEVQGDRGSTLVKVAGSIPAGVSGFFIDIKSFRSHYGPGVDSASNRNEYQEYFLRVKAAGA